jgi:hypothetical protein
LTGVIGRAARAGVIAAVALMGAAGCASGSDPVPQQPPSLDELRSARAPGPTASPGSAAVRIAVMGYVDGLNLALRTGNTGPARAVTTETCNCRKEIRRIGETYRSKGRFEGVRLEVRTISPSDVSPSAAKATLVYEQTAGRYVSPKGTPRPVPAKSGQTFSVTLQHIPGRWLIASVTR